MRGRIEDVLIDLAADMRAERDAARADVRRLERRVDALTRERDRLRRLLAAAEDQSTVDMVQDTRSMLADEHREEVV